MYDILQLNDMLVPELLDIAEQESISNAKTLDKQELIYKILDKQAVMNNSEKTPAEPEKPKRKRIIKTKSEEVSSDDPVNYRFNKRDEAKEDRGEKKDC